MQSQPLCRTHFGQYQASLISCTGVTGRWDSFESNRYAHSRLKSTHEVTTHDTQIELMTCRHSIYICEYITSITNIVTMGIYTMVTLYTPVYLFCICCQSTQDHRYSCQVCYKHHSHKVGHKQLKKEHNRWQYEQAFALAFIIHNHLQVRSALNLHVGNKCWYKIS